MNANTVTLIVGLAGIAATLIASSLGLHFTAKARTAPLRELLYSKQIELISQIVHKQGRFRVYATLLASDASEFKDNARDDIGACVRDYSELTEKAAVIVPTDLWVEIKRLSNFMAELLVTYDENGIVDETAMLELAGMDAKVALVSRTVLGVDELTEESLKLFSSDKDFERLASIESRELADLSKTRDA